MTITTTDLTYFVFQTKTIFVPFKHLYPECYILIEKHSQLHPLFCMKADCPANRGCIEVMCKRVNYLFQEVEPLAEMMIAYFKYPDSPSLRAGIFKKELSEPYIMKVNPYGFEKFRREGIIKQWKPSFEYININSLHQLPQIIPATNLVKK